MEVERRGEGRQRRSKRISSTPSTWRGSSLHSSFWSAFLAGDSLFGRWRTHLPLPNE